VLMSGWTCGGVHSIGKSDKWREQAPAADGASGLFPHCQSAGICGDKTQT